MPNPQVPTDPLDLTTEKAEHHVDRMLDEAIAESFPTSDPVALSMPHDRVERPSSRVSELPAAIRDAWPLIVIGGIIATLLLVRRR